MEALKPCQCGNETPSLEEFNSDPQYIVRCYRCHSSSGICNTREDMIAKWNTRPIEDGLRAELARAQAEKAVLERQIAEATIGHPTLPEVMLADAYQREIDELRAERDALAKELADGACECPYLTIWDGSPWSPPEWCECTDTAEDGFDCPVQDPAACWILWAKEHVRGRI